MSRADDIWECRLEKREVRSYYLSATRPLRRRRNRGWTYRFAKKYISFLWANETGQQRCVLETAVGFESNIIPHRLLPINVRVGFNLNFKTPGNTCNGSGVTGESDDASFQIKNILGLLNSRMQPLRSSTSQKNLSVNRNLENVTLKPYDNATAWWRWPNAAAAQASRDLTVKMFQ